MPSARSNPRRKKRAAPARRRPRVPRYPHGEVASTYARHVVTGKILACKWVRLACQRHLTDLTRRDWPYRFDKQKAERACKFIELLPHTKGRWAAKQERLILQPWQCFIVCSLFGWVHKQTGYRRFREAYCEIPRKNGKSLFAAGIGHIMFCDDDEYGAEVYSGATSEKQAWEIFRPARLMALRTPDLQEEYGVTVNASNLAILDNGSRFEPVIGSPGDGASPSCALIDEYHEHQRDDLYDTMTTGMGSREQPLTLIVTTAGTNLAGPCYFKRAEVCKILEGVEQDERIFALIYTIDEADDWTSEVALRKANPNYDISVSAEYLHDRLRGAMRTAIRQNPFKTKHLNIWCGAMNAWMDMQQWAKAPPRKSLDELVGRRCFAGLDLASKVDIAALVLLFPPEGDDPLWHVHGRYYLPEEVIEDHEGSNVSHYDAWAKQGYLTLTPGNAIDDEYIEADIKDLSSRFTMQHIAFDPWNAQSLVNRLQKEFPIKRLPDGTQGSVLVEVRATVQHYSEPMKEAEKLVRKKLLAHGHCPLLTWMASNVVARADKKDNIYPVKELPENKIDGIVALIMALNRAIMKPPKKTSVYEKRGLTTV